MRESVTFVANVVRRSRSSNMTVADNAGVCTWLADNHNQLASMCVCIWPPHQGSWHACRTRKRLNRRWGRNIHRWKLLESWNGVSKSGIVFCHEDQFYMQAGFAVYRGNGNSPDYSFLCLLCRDKTRPNSAFAPENLTLLPDEKDLEPTLGEQVATWIRNLRKWPFPCNSCCLCSGCWLALYPLSD